MASEKATAISQIARRLGLNLIIVSHRQRNGACTQLWTGPKRLVPYLFSVCYRSFMQNAEPAAEAAPQAKNLNPTVGDLMDAYLADRRDPHAERRCKHPEGLASCLVASRELWGAMTIKEFGH